jgi:gliding motility-associated-like protein
MKKALSLLIILSCFFVHRSYAQSSVCPDNIDFEMGDFSNWSLYTGTCCAINTPTLSGPVATRHTIMSGTGTDMYGGFPVVAPGGGTYSLKLGNNGTGSQAERARYYVHVPSTGGAYILIYRYAVVFQNPTHTAAQQPRFEVKAYDSATNTPIACSQFTYVSSSSLPGFQLSSVGSQVWYKSWTTSTIDLSAAGGTTVAVDFASGDCALGGHFGYGYVDLNCGLFSIKASPCDTFSTTIPLLGPPGFQKYYWWDSLFTTFVDSTQNVSVPRPTVPTTYALVVVPYPGFGCQDTLYATVDTAIVPPPVPPTSPNVHYCVGQTAVPLSASGSAVKWYTTATGGTGSSTPPTPNTSTVHNDTFYVTQTSSGCESPRGMVIVFVHPIPPAPFAPDTAVCLDIVINLNSTGTFPKWYTAATGGTGTPAPFSPPTATAGTTFYYVSQTDSFGCESPRDTMRLIVNPLPSPPVSPNVAYCLNASPLPLSATGTNLKWYTAPVGGIGTTIPPVPGTSVPGNTWYYVTQTDANGCESPRQFQVVTVFPIPPAPSVKDADLCQYTPALPLDSYVTSGINLKWYTSATGGTGSTTPPVISTATSYFMFVYVSQTVNGCEGLRATLMIKVYPKPTPPTVTKNYVLCQYAPGFTLNAVGKNILWYTTATGGTGSTTKPVITTGTPGTFIHYASQTDNGCESDRDSITVVIHPKPNPPSVPNVTTCEGAPVIVLNSPGANTKWYPSAGGTPLLNNPLYIQTNIPKTIKYYITQTLNNCESDRDSVEIVINAIPPPPVVSPVDYCLNRPSVPLTAIGQNLMWYTAPNGGAGSSVSPTPSTDTYGTLSWYVSQTVNGCESPRAKLDIIVDTNAKVTLAANPYVCVHDPLTVTYSGDIPSSGAFDWKFDSDGLIISGGGPGPYVVKWPTVGHKIVSIYANLMGCVGRAELPVEVMPLPDAALTMQPEGCIDEAVMVEAVPNLQHASIYNWDLGDAKVIGQSQNKYSLSWGSSGPRKVSLYTVSTYGCKSAVFSDDIFIRPNPITEILTVEDKDICIGDTIVVKAKLLENEHTYHWAPEKYFVTNEQVSASMIARQNPYTLTITDIAGCKGYDTAIVDMHPCCDLFLPSAFTPNGDGRNDLFRPMTIGHQELIKFVVMNRFGQVVYESEDVTKGWDGSFKSEPQDMATYFYYLKYKCSDETVWEKKGDVTLVR